MQSNENESWFITERLPLAAYLHASGRLKFRSCGFGPDASNGKVRFVFDDPGNIGDQLELEFDQFLPGHFQFRVAIKRPFVRGFLQPLIRGRDQGMHGAARLDLLEFGMHLPLRFRQLRQQDFFRWHAAEFAYKADPAQEPD